MFNKTAPSTVTQDTRIDLKAEASQIYLFSYSFRIYVAEAPAG